ncbi:MAG: FAD-binding oxidoreductase [Proteobacteria bacterium]|nr:FAD-binding oxidoreductase [Pseudomonadota bacterium]
MLTTSSAPFESIPVRRLLRSPSDLEHYGRDWTRRFVPSPSAVALPESVAEVQALVRWANQTGAPLVPSGGRTGLSGGAVAANGEVVVSLESMRSILSFDAADRLLTVQAGITTQAVQDAARERDLIYPVDFASRGSSQIGGNVATNAGGIKVLRYGLTRNWVAGLKVVTGSGELLDLNRGLVKNATGYDLRHLFVGSEGTLGVIVEVALRLAEPPPQQQVMVLALPRLDALTELLDRLRRRLVLSAFEFFSDKALAHVVRAGGRRPFEAPAPWYVLAEFDADQEAALSAFDEALADGLVNDGVLGQSDAQAQELWRLREGITESLSHLRPYKNDIAVRVGMLPTFLTAADGFFAREYPEFEVVWFGHIGDGNLHISVIHPDAMSDEAFTASCERVTHRLGALLSEFGGSISAEHGVGLLKKDYLHYSRSSPEIELMRAMKRVFDPAGVLNPGKVF